jgi:PAS domain S-box-containing protein
LTENLQEGVWAIDKAAVTTYVNPRMAEILGYTVPEMIGKHLFSFMDESGVELAKTELARRQQGIKERHDFEFRRKDGSLVYASLETAPLLDEQGNYAGALAGITDVTELRKLDKLKEEFLSTTSHELRTPLTIIKEGVDGVLDELVGPITPEQQQYLTTVKKNIDRLARIVNQTLDISKIKAGKLAVRPAELDLREIIHEAVERFGGKAKEKSIDLSAPLAGRPIPAYADPDLLRQILDNLIGNALKFTAQGGMISVDAAEKERAIEVSVSDNGIGMAREDHARLFTRFTQLVRIPGPGEKGTGLGLAIVKSLVEAQGGMIRVESEQGKGSKFTFTVPLSKGTQTG